MIDSRTRNLPGLKLKVYTSWRCGWLPASQQLDVSVPQGPHDAGAWEEFLWWVVLKSEEISTSYRKAICYSRTPKSPVALSHIAVWSWGWLTFPGFTISFWKLGMRLPTSKVR